VSDLKICGICNWPFFGSGTGLPDFSWYSIPTQEKYNNIPQIIPNGRKICQHLSLQDPSNFTQSSIFGLKIHHLATLLWQS
jgi:hypothetical protein